LAFLDQPKLDFLKTYTIAVDYDRKH